MTCSPAIARALARRPGGALSDGRRRSRGPALELLSRLVPGFSLERALHLDPEVYRLELERIWRPAWLFAAHTAELRRPGERAVFDVGDDSVLIVRGEDGEVRAFHNLCRHRGTRPATSRRTVARPARAPASSPPGPGAFVRCPYHQWAYRLDGSLGRLRRDGKRRGPGQERLRAPAGRMRRTGRAHFRAPRAGAGARTGVAPGPRCTSLARGPVAPGPGPGQSGLPPRAMWSAAGWKILWENNRECWHCHVGHPEYIKSHFDTSDTDLTARCGSASPGGPRPCSRALAGWPPGEVFDGAGLALFPSPGRSWSAHRTPLVEGYCHRVVGRRPGRSPDGRLPEL